MKKAALLLALILISTIGYSQQGGNDPIGGIDIIIKRDPSSQPIVNTGSNPLVDQINKLEFEYLNLKAKEVQYGFANQNLSHLNTKDDVFREYIVYLKKKIVAERAKVERKDIRKVMKYRKIAPTQKGSKTIKMKK